MRLQVAVNVRERVFLKYSLKKNKKRDELKDGSEAGPEGEGGPVLGATSGRRHRSAVRDGHSSVCFLAAVPSFPYGVTLLNCDGRSMTLGWKVPRFSGGAPILGYFVDRREAHHRNWHEVNSSPIKERLITVRLAGRRGLLGGCARARTRPSGAPGAHVLGHVLRRQRCAAA